MRRRCAGANEKLKIAMTSLLNLPYPQTLVQQEHKLAGERGDHLGAGSRDAMLVQQIRLLLGLFFIYATFFSGV